MERETLHKINGKTIPDFSTRMRKERKTVKRVHIGGRKGGNPL